MFKICTLNVTNETISDKCVFLLRFAVLTILVSLIKNDIRYNESELIIDHSVKLNYTRWKFLYEEREKGVKR